LVERLAMWGNSMAESMADLTVQWMASMMVGRVLTWARMMAGMMGDLKDTR